MGYGYAVNCGAVYYLEQRSGIPPSPSFTTINFDAIVNMLVFVPGRNSLLAGRHGDPM